MDGMGELLGTNGQWDATAPAPGGSAVMNYYYNDLGGGVYQYIVTRGVAGSGYKVRRYSTTLNEPIIELIRMPDNLNETFMISNNQIRVGFQFSGTQRRFSNSGCFAAFIGILAETNADELAVSVNDIGHNGACFEDATCWPSYSHPNGDSIDTRYINYTGDEDEELDTVNWPLQRTFTSAFIDWGFQEVIAGDLMIQAARLPDAHVHNEDHNNHLHSGNFEEDESVQIIIEENED